MENRLLLLNGPTPGVSVQLDPNAAGFTIGRDVARDLPMDDHLASRLHARLWYDGRAWQIEDCGSLNGTRVNSQPVGRAVLATGDVIRIGDRLIVFLSEVSSPESGRLSPSVFSASTRLIRLDARDKESALLEIFDGQSTSRPIRNLSLVYRLATALHAAGEEGQLTRLVCQTLHEATLAGVITIWLTGQDGRLRRAAGIPESPTSSVRDHLLASVVMENDEALLIEAERNQTTPTVGKASIEADDVGSAVGVPVPGRVRPRGAIECYDSAKDTGFDRQDLELVVAVAHQFGMALENLEHRERLEQTNEQLRRRVSQQTRLLGRCPEIQRLHDQVSRVAPTASMVLVLGESGTGKELVAQTIHEMSPRSSGPFVAVNCAAFTESLLESELFGHEAGAFTGADQRRMGQFERAHRGTIFLDEVAEMSPACQAKLLRMLEGQAFYRLGGGHPIRVDLRVVAATHRDLRAWVQDNRFRDDLYYRLRVIELRLPALRERGDDILDLAVLFLDRFRQEIGRGPPRFSREAALAISSYHWPGNVRELKNAVERAVVLSQSDEVMTEDLGISQGGVGSVDEEPLVSLDAASQRHIERVMKAVGGNKTHACQILGIGRGTLYKKLETMELGSTQH